VRALDTGSSDRDASMIARPSHTMHRYSTHEAKGLIYQLSLSARCPIAEACSAGYNNSSPDKTM
jgi:hypothetical protein